MEKRGAKKQKGRCADKGPGIKKVGCGKRAKITHVRSGPPETQTPSGADVIFSFVHLVFCFIWCLRFSDSCFLLSFEVYFSCFVKYVEHKWF